MVKVPTNFAYITGITRRRNYTFFNCCGSWKLQKSKIDMTASSSCRRVEIQGYKQKTTALIVLNRRQDMQKQAHKTNLPSSGFFLFRHRADQRDEYYLSDMLIASTATLPPRTTSIRLGKISCSFLIKSLFRFSVCTHSNNIDVVS